MSPRRPKDAPDPDTTPDDTPDPSPEAAPEGNESAMAGRVNPDAEPANPDE